MLDISIISQNLGFEEDETIMLFEMFIESATDSMISLKSAIESHDYEQIKQHTHSIKGSAANIMLDEVANIAKEIETSAINSSNINYEDKYKLLDNALQNIKLIEKLC